MKDTQRWLLFVLFIMYSILGFSADRTSDRIPLTDSDSSEHTISDGLNTQSAPARGSRGRLGSTPKGTPRGTPKRSRSKSKSGTYFINPAMIDGFTAETIQKNTTLIKNAAKQYNLKKSNIYTVVLGLKTFQFDPATIGWANHFFLNVVAEECCVDYFKNGVDIIQTSDPDYEKCIECIRTELNLRIDNAIQWPSIERKENSELYYKQLLENNQAIDTRKVYHPYCGAMVAVYMLAQLNRSPDSKAMAQAIAESSSTRKQCLKKVQQQLIDMARCLSGGEPCPIAVH